MLARLNFINRTDSGHQASILLFQGNASADLPSSTVAWKVIRHCGKDCSHPFLYSSDFEIALSDEFGNYSPRQAAPYGSLFAVTTCALGRQLSRRGAADKNRQIVLRNELARGAVNANIYAAGRLLACRNGIAPGQKALFEFKQTLSIGIATQAEEGQIIDVTGIAGPLTELSLSGVASADIVMSGGAGNAARLYEFNLDNLQKA